MKVLWFSLSPANFSHRNIGYNGCGWIASLERAISARGDVELGIAFLHSSSVGKERRGNVTYYPMRRQQSPLARASRFFRISAQDRMELDLCKRVIDDFNPDVIQVFGTESSFGLISRETDIPVVIHLQGLMGPYLNAWVPPGYRMCDYVCRGSMNPAQIAFGLRALAFNRHAAAREQVIMRSGKAFMGRTAWDRAFVSLTAPQARYFECWEVLRSCFYEPGEWSPPSKPVFVSTISGPLYKGHDMVLKIARVLRDSGLHDFEWRVYGVQDLRFAERKTGIRASGVGIRPMGVATAELLREALLHSSMYVHPSYIDNSPNSVCEAQILGVPVIATDVGGVSSLFPAGNDAGLIPSNDPLMAAFRIREALLTPGKFRSDRSACAARHDCFAIASRVHSIYSELIRSYGEG